jgi:hypothetical protein
MSTATGDILVFASTQHREHADLYRKSTRMAER